MPGIGGESKQILISSGLCFVLFLPSSLLVGKVRRNDIEVVKGETQCCLTGPRCVREMGIIFFKIYLFI